jgi:predicted ATPase with chaperone activity
MVAASEQIQTTLVGNHLAVGELAMHGTVPPAEGVLPIALGTRADGEDEGMMACGCDQIPFLLA